MKGKIKQICYIIVVLVLTIMPMQKIQANSTEPPRFEEHFAKPLLKGTSGDQGTEKFADISCVNRDMSIKENIQCLLFPAGNGGYLWGILRYLGYIFVFIAIVRAAFKLLFGAKKTEDLIAVMKSFAMILVGSALYFGAIWIFSSLFNIAAIKTTKELSDTIVNKSGFMFFILSLFKTGAFFYAIIMIVMTGFQMMNPVSAEEGGSKKLITKLAGVIAALVGLKVVDFLYFIASQGNFSVQAGAFIITIAKFLAYLSGSVMVVMIIYAGYQLIIDGGKGENFKKAKNILINILLGVVSLFFFLFVLYQIFSEFN